MRAIAAVAICLVVGACNSTAAKREAPSEMKAAPASLPDEDINEQLDKELDQQLKNSFKDGARKMMRIGHICGRERLVYLVANSEESASDIARAAFEHCKHVWRLAATEVALYNGAPQHAEAGLRAIEEEYIKEATAVVTTARANARRRTREHIEREKAGSPTSKERKPPGLDI